MSGRISERDIKPIRLVFKEKHWYLQAFCMKADDFRLFKVSRIIKVENTGAGFVENFSETPPLESKEPSDYPKNIIKLRISSALAFRVYDEFGLESIETQEDGSFIVTVALTIDNWVIGYIFSFGTEIEILEPVELKTQLYNYAHKILKHYKT